MKNVVKIVLIILISICLVSCGLKEDNEGESSSDKATEIVKTADDYVGACDYITENQIYDYSNIFETTYEWDKGVKMPLEKPENALVGWSAASFPFADNMYIYNLTIEELKVYMQEQNKLGFEMFENGETFVLYKNNFRITFNYYESDNVFSVFCYAGNVIYEVSDSIEEAKKLIETKGLLDGNTTFEDYIVFMIQNETVSQLGYYEFLIETPYQNAKESTFPYYMITDGKEVVLFEQGIIRTLLPSNVNAVKTDKGVSLVVCSVKYEQNYYNYINLFSLKEGMFNKDKEMFLSEVPNLKEVEEIVLSKVESSEIKYYVIKALENYDYQLGKKDYWILDREFNLNE